MEVGNGTHNEGAGTAWLLRDGDVLASAHLATTHRQRMRGLLGRREFEGALVLRPCRQVHTWAMRFPIDVAFCTGDGVVLHIATMRPWRMSRLVRRAAFAVEASAGAFERWQLRPLDVLEVKE
jgi:uncharacterized membrane protein (UPF0127 family)